MTRPTHTCVGFTSDTDHQVPTRYAVPFVIGLCLVAWLVFIALLVGASELLGILA